MNSANIHEVRQNLAEYLAAAERGEEVLICRRNQPVARLVRIDSPPVQRKPRPIGRAADAGVVVPASFFDPLPDEMLAALTGSSAMADDPLRVVAPRARRSAAATKPAATAKRGRAPRR